MATLVVETGAVVSGANTYASAADFSTYLSNRGVSFESLVGSSEQTLIMAMDYLETREFIGSKASKDQPLQWPRSGVFIDGFSYTDSEIPELLKKVQMEIAYAIDTGNNPNSPIDRKTKREKVGDIEVEYADDSDDVVELKAVRDILAKLTIHSSSRTGSVTIERV